MRLNTNKCFIFDIDGTLADNGHRQDWVKTKPKNWTAYNKTMGEDTPIIPVITVLRHLQYGGTPFHIFICSGREEIYRQVTEGWLEEQDIEHDGLFMRKEQDYRDDCIVKKEMLDTIIKTYEVVGVFDDRYKVVNMWREQGLFVFDVNQTRSIF